MTVKTLGTNATTTLNAVQWPSSYGGVALSDADIATIALSILNDQVPRQKRTPVIQAGAFSRDGLLFLPNNRGVIKLEPGDWVWVDPSGFPGVIGKRAVAATAATTGDTNTSTAITNLATNVLTLGWSSNMQILSSNNDITAGTVISAIASDGLSLTLSAAATASNAGGTLTVGAWTHS